MNILRSPVARTAIFLVLAALATLIVAVEPASAQAPAPTGNVAPPIPTINRSPHPAIGYGVMFVLLVAVIAVSIMPSKRGHQD